MYFDQAFEKVVTLFSQIQSKDMAWVVEDMFTPAEIAELGERIELLTQLQQWKTQRGIASDMWISVTTVSRGARVLKYGKWIIKKYL